MVRDDIKEEIVCGFKVSSNRKKLWHCELLMLEILEEVSQENNLDYFLIFGSVLGAVRHNGFIPWDDDIDIGMTRENFDKFLKVAGKYYDKDIFEIQYGYRKPIYDFILRIRDKRTTGITSQEVDANGCKGAFIEVYPFDHVSKNIIRDIQITVNYFIYKILITKSRSINNFHGKGKAVRILAGFFPRRVLWGFYNYVCRFQNTWSKADYVDLISVPTYAKRKWGLMKFDSVSTTTKVLYEYIETRIPANYDELLTNNYGDYMQLPTAEERGKYHENIVFYDPNLPYTVYDHTSEIEKYFSNQSMSDMI